MIEELTRDRLLLRSTGLALLVGTILNLINQWHAIFGAAPLRPLQGALTYLVPFAVAMYSSMRATRRAENKQRSTLAHTTDDRPQISAMWEAVDRIEEAVLQVDGNAKRVNTTSKARVEFAEQAAQLSREVADSSREIANLTEHSSHQVAEVDEVFARTDAQQRKFKTEFGQAGRWAMELLVSTQQFRGEFNKIDKITRTITDIADQTNLLALNASIEAARAGDAGRGFAVVADEVKGLAQKSSDYTKEIAGVLQSLGASSAALVSKIENFADTMQQMTNLTDETLAQRLQDAIATLRAGIGDVNRHAGKQIAQVEETVSRVETMAADAHAAVEGSGKNMRIVEQTLPVVDRLRVLLHELKNTR